MREDNEHANTRLRDRKGAIVNLFEHATTRTLSQIDEEYGEGHGQRGTGRREVAEEKAGTRHQDESERAHSQSVVCARVRCVACAWACVGRGARGAWRRIRC
eukprot:6157167-Pleurochrysis_carterae.AAC.1